MVGIVKRTALALALALLAGLAAGLWPLWRAARALPVIDVHERPWTTQSGRLLERYPLGQSFRCAADGLERIEVALVPMESPPRGTLVLRLCADGPKGELLREVERAPDALAPPGALVAFAFEPVEGSAGKVFHFELRPGAGPRPADWAAWIRYRGREGHEGAWGNRTYEQPVLEGLVRPSIAPGREEGFDPIAKPDNVPHPFFRALSFAALQLAPRLGEARLELWELDAQGPPLRSASLAPEDEVRDGFAFFSFEPIADSRFRMYRYRLVLPPGSVLVGDAVGPTMKSWHGLDRAGGDLLGASVGGEPRPDRDLVFRAFARPAPARALALVRERAGWRLWAGLFAWLAASTALIALVLPRPAKDREREGIPSARSRS